MEASAPSPNIPNEIIRIILLQLPVESIIRFQCVCKQWRSMIQDSDFKLSYGGQGRLIILSHESERWGFQNPRQLVVRSTTRHDDLRLERQKWQLGEAAAYPLIHGIDQYGATASYPCNGFVLLAAAERDILLWNPLTRCSTKVLESPYPWTKNMGAFVGLCYDSCTRDYKVVLLLRQLMRWDHSFNNQYAIFASLTHKEWQSVQFPFWFDAVRGGVDFRNTFHWWVSYITVPYWNRKYLPRADMNRIVYFDPMCDKFRILSTPSELRANNTIVGLGVIDDCLSLACIDEEETNTNQVFIMKEYGIEESWMIAFAIQMPQLTDTYHLTFYSHTNNTKQVLFMLRGSNWPHLYVYDRKKEKLKEVLVDFLKQNSNHGNFASMFFYVENFNCLALQPHEYM